MWFEQGDMEHILNAVVCWQLEAEGHGIDLFRDCEGAEALVVELGSRGGGLNVSTKEPYFVARFEGMFLTFLVSLCLVVFLSFLKFEVEVFLDVLKGGSKVLCGRICLNS